MNASAYVREVAAAWRFATGWRSRLRLFGATAWWHLNNGLHVWDRNTTTVGVDVHVGAGCHRLTLRPFAGDVFVLYEVLGSDCYRIPATRLDPASVRVIVDLGANVGITSLYLASQYPAARIISVEPDPENFALLSANTVREPRIRPVHAAVTATRQPAVFLSQDAASWGRRTSAIAIGARDIEVPAVTVDDLMRDHHLDAIDLLKVDIEGAEESLFAHPGFLERVRFIIIELHGAYSADDLQRDLRPMGLTVRAAEPSGSIMITADRAAR